MFHDYLDKLVAPVSGQVPVSAPASGDYSSLANPALSMMYKNNVWGCCVPAWLMHQMGIWTGNSGLVTGGELYSDSQLAQFYKQCSGGNFDPSNPTATDNGCDEMTAIQSCISTGWPDNGQGSQKATGVMAVDGTNWEHVKLAMWLFEGVTNGLEVPDGIIQNMPSTNGFIWDVLSGQAGQPDPNNGHCTGLFSWDDSGAGLSTWGMKGRATRDFVGTYMVPGAGGELYAILSDQVIARAQVKAPNGFDFVTLQDDLQALQAA